MSRAPRGMEGRRRCRKHATAVAHGAFPSHVYRCPGPQDYFHNRIAQLTYTFPEDATTSTGAPFWSAPKRFPRPLNFDPNDKAHAAFVQVGNTGWGSSCGRRVGARQLCEGVPAVRMCIASKHQCASKQTQSCHKSGHVSHLASLHGCERNLIRYTAVNATNSLAAGWRHPACRGVRHPAARLGGRPGQGGGGGGQGGRAGLHAQGGRADRDRPQGGAHQACGRTRKE